MEKLTERLPLERVAVLIGRNGEVKAEIEELTGAKLNVDGKTGEVEITPGREAKDKGDYNVYRASLIVQAIAVGFSPQRALSLLEDYQFLEVIDLREFARKPGDASKIASRVIGTEGRARKELERRSKALISVFDNQVGVIGDSEALVLVGKAVELIIKGLPHASVYSLIEKEKKRHEEESFKARI
ncbi:MAG TPA: KH domain-containing protein [archaeon]|nr:KH domain-containing protein [archaeon]